MAGGECGSASAADRTAHVPARIPDELYPLPMTLSAADVHRIAQLARLDVSAGEAEEVRAKLDAIFAMINELSAIDTSGVVPMAHAQDASLPLREDRVTEVDRHALYQSVAPAVEDALYLVPKVIE